MGTINYKTSDYITLSIRPYDTDDIRQGLIDDINAGEYDGITADMITDNMIYDTITECYDADSENAQTIIDEYKLWYFRVTIEPGYYEGLSIDIQNNFPVFFDNYEEKKEAQKEVTQLKKLLFDLAGCGYVETSPGWITGYKDYKNTLQGIKEAIRDIRQEVATTPTFRDYEADRHYKHM